MGAFGYLTTRMTLILLTSLMPARTSGTSPPSLRGGDYTTAEQLSNETALPLYTLLWRAVGSSFAGESASLNMSFIEDANTAFLAAPHTMTYTVVNLRPTGAASTTTRKLNGVKGVYKYSIQCVSWQSVSVSARLVQVSKSQTYQELHTAA